MKKLLSIIFCISVFFLSSCDEFLELTPTNSIVASKALTTVNEATVAMNGIYNRITYSNYYGQRMTKYADMRGGDLYVPSNGRSDDSFFLFNHEESRNNYGTMWDVIYKVIMLCNNVIENIENGNVTTTTSAQEAALNDVKGQALAIRALAHFDLLRLYSLPYLKSGAPSSLGVPIATRVIAAQEKLIRNTVEDVYTQIISDLTTAIPILKNAKSNGRINQYGAKAVLARVYLYKGDYDNAYTQATEIINSNVYTLYTSANWVNSWKSAFGSESIFELSISTSDATNLGNSSLTSFYAPMYYNSAFLAGAVASDQYLNLLAEDPEDVRWGVMDLDEYGNPIRNPTRSIPGRKGWIKKYMGDKSDAISATNVKIVRLSEVYLIAAEASLKKTTSNKTAAVSYLNAIRSRAVSLPPASSSASDEALETLILNERSKELIAEGHRFFDLMRLGKTIIFDDPASKFNEPILVTNGRGLTVTWNFEKIILPISDYERNANPTIQQNPGYE